MLEFLEYEADLDLLLIYHTGEDTESTAGTRQPLIDAAMRDYSPAKILIVMDHAAWNVSAGRFQAMAQAAAHGFAGLPVAIAMPQSLPQPQLQSLQDAADRYGVPMKLFACEDSARLWLARDHPDPNA